jgi:hypothetical protein
VRVSRSWKPTKQTVELQLGARPSRIRREPIARAPDRAVRAYPTEREIWTVAIGVVMFALAITIIIFGVSDYTAN